MACPSYKKLCKRLIISTAVTFADGTLTINIPDGYYANGEKYCIENKLKYFITPNWLINE